MQWNQSFPTSLFNHYYGVTLCSIGCKHLGCKHLQGNRSLIIRTQNSELTFLCTERVESNTDQDYWCIHEGKSNACEVTAIYLGQINMTSTVSRPDPHVFTCSGRRQCTMQPEQTPPKPRMNNHIHDDRIER